MPDLIFVRKFLMQKIIYYWKIYKNVFFLLFRPFLLILRYCIKTLLLFLIYFENIKARKYKIKELKEQKLLEIALTSFACNALTGFTSFFNFAFTSSWEKFHNCWEWPNTNCARKTIKKDLKNEKLSFNASSCFSF